MVSQQMVAEAAERTGYRADLVKSAVLVIVARYRAGETVKKITRYMVDNLGPDNRAASAEFVRWAIAAAGGEAR
ncbi:hypothetical protein BAY59_36550 [Prauserella coralliicola]|nr:hypothetical protein BAY59_36550 [Prauserella coralliicola]